MTALELLRDGRAWLDDPSHWIRGRFLRFSDDHREITGSCANGASYVGFYQRGEAIRTTEELTVINRALHKIAQEMGYNTVPHLNDNGGYEEALELLDRGIRELEQQADAFASWDAEMAPQVEGLMAEFALV